MQLAIEVDQDITQIMLSLTAVLVMPCPRGDILGLNPEQLSTTSSYYVSTICHLLRVSPLSLRTPNGGLVAEEARQKLINFIS